MCSLLIPEICNSRTSKARRLSKSVEHSSDIIFLIGMNFPVLQEILNDLVEMER